MRGTASRRIFGFDARRRDKSIPIATTAHFSTINNADTSPNTACANVARSLRGDIPDGIENGLP